jgi:UDP-glucose:(heptosyl)LPS alpha-1,3-glucosyltransferase
VHVASLQAKRWLIDEKFASEEEISYIPHGVDPAKFPEASEQDRAAARAGFGLAPDATVAAYVGRLDWPKNEEWLLDVVKRCDCHLLVAGDGPHAEQFKSTAQRLGVKDRVHLFGELDNPLPVYQASDAMLLPSRREGFSYVNAEAMSVGTPMLRTHTSGAEELIEQNVTGRYVPINHEAFVSTACDFLGDRARLAQMRTRCAATVREKFTFQSQIEKTIELYRGLTSHGR